jgi:hypothetical protein
VSVAITDPDGAMVLGGARGGVVGVGVVALAEAQSAGQLLEVSNPSQVLSPQHGCVCPAAHISGPVGPGHPVKLRRRAVSSAPQVLAQPVLLKNTSNSSQSIGGFRQRSVQAGSCNLVAAVRSGSGSGSGPTFCQLSADVCQTSKVNAVMPSGGERIRVGLGAAHCTSIGAYAERLSGRAALHQAVGAAAIPVDEISQESYFVRCKLNRHRVLH